MAKHQPLGFCSAGEDTQRHVVLRVLVVLLCVGLSVFPIAIPTMAYTSRLKGPYAVQLKESAQDDEVHVVFVSDCSGHTGWQSELLFLSAQYIGQRGAITQVAVGCSIASQKRMLQRLRSLGLPNEFKLHFVVPDTNDARSHTINKVYGLRSWFREVGPERDVVTFIDPDFIFVRPLTARIDATAMAYGWNATERPERVRKGMPVAQRWPLMWWTDSKEQWRPPIARPPQNLSGAELMAWLCSGELGGQSLCAGATKEEVSLYHGTGVPHMWHRSDMDEWFVDTWADITTRYHVIDDGYYVEMHSMMMSHIHHGVRQFAVHNLSLRMPADAQGDRHLESWEFLAELQVDPCTSPMEQVLAHPRMGPFIHYCQNYPGWSKYWVHGYGKGGAHALENCDANYSDGGLAKLLNAAPNMSEPETAFIVCVTRRMLAGAIKRTCAGRAAAKAVEDMSAGFTF
mmetsp:Transcript_58554/g.164224  ORF Transcript_58554/g.164224 Transcript_58554/m.164224 type:complete len:457 (+) Transcript_58554:99-1469(+)